jgi:hypothetical protein
LIGIARAASVAVLIYTLAVFAIVLTIFVAVARRTRDGSG